MYIFGIATSVKLFTYMKRVKESHVSMASSCNSTPRVNGVTMQPLHV